MQTLPSCFAEQSVLYAPHQYGIVTDSLLWNWDFILVFVFVIAVFGLFYRFLAPYDNTKKTLNTAFFVTLLIVIVGGTLVWYSDYRSRKFWEERLFLLAQGYAGTVEMLNLDSLPVDPSATGYPEYKATYDLFEKWQLKDSIISNICVFHIDQDGHFIYLIRPAADFNGDGEIDGELEEAAVPGQVYAAAQNEPVLLNAVWTATPQMTPSLYYAGGTPCLYAAVPIHQKNDKVDLLFVVDFQTKRWISNIHGSRSIPLFGMVISFLLLIGATTQVLLGRQLQVNALDIVAKNERKYNQIIDNSHDAISLLRDGFFIFSNSQMHLLFGCVESDLDEKTPLDISPRFQPDGRPSAKTLREYMESAEKGNMTFFNWSFLKTDGSVFNAEVSLDPIVVDGEPLLILVAHDQSDLRRAIRAEKETRIKSNFLANVSHEIRTPLTAIIGYTDHILYERKLHSRSLECDDWHRDDCLRLRDQQTHYVQIVRNNAEFLLLILNDILDMAKIEADKMTIENIDVEFQPLFQEIVSHYAQKASEKGLQFYVISETPLPKIIKTDPIRLKQVLVNLIGNAIKFTEKGSINVVASWKMDDYPPQWDEDSPHFMIPEPCHGTLTLSVKDTGIGIPEHALPDVGLAFHQADTAMSRRFGGTGLGLSISKRLVSLLKGDMQIHSVFEEGSTFIVSFRQSLEAHSNWLSWDYMHNEEKQIIGQSVIHPKEQFKEMQVLLVEDCVETQRLVALILKKAGAEVCIVENGWEAVEKLQNRRTVGTPFDIVLMDLQMPIMDGYEATSKIRHWECLCDAPRTTIVALTANSSDENRTKAWDVGMDDFCSKPINFPHLFQVIRNWNARKQKNTVLSIG